MLFHKYFMRDKTTEMLKQLIETLAGNIPTTLHKSYFNYFVSKKWAEYINGRYKITPKGVEEYHRRIKEEQNNLFNMNYYKAATCAFFFMSTLYFALLWLEVTWLLRPNWLPVGKEEPLTVILGSLFTIIILWRKW